MTPDPDLIRLLDAAHDATRNIGPGVQAIELYKAGALAAESHLPSPIGTAVAGVLAMAAELRRAQRLRGTLGEHKTMLALALTVLALSPEQP